MILRIAPHLVLLWTLLVGPAATSAPNVVFILADDLGWGEVGAYGQKKILTPNLDRLASEGLRFTRHYSGAPVCAPARCTLLTGQNLSRAQIRGNRDSGNGRVFPGQWPLTAEVVTLGETMQAAGYRTGAFGKWGLGPSNTVGNPIDQGFDVYYGYNCQRNAHSFYPPFLDSQKKEVRINRRPIPGHERKPEGEIIADDYRDENYAPDLILTEATKFLDHNAKAPFFLYLPFVEPHVAMQPPQEWVDRYPKEWDVEKGAYRGQCGYLPHPRPRAGYAAMISDLDEHVGTILALLAKHGIADDTLVVFTSDNGTTHRGADPKFGIGGCDADFFESTAGLRSFKGSVYEGGLRVPCIVRWPGKVAAGSVTDFPSYFPDWYPTLCGIAGAETPAGQLDGHDLRPTLLGEEQPLREGSMVWEFSGYYGQLAVMDGDWKAVRQRVNTPKPGPWELYHLGDDPAETKDLAAEQPERVQALEAYWLEHRTEEEDFPLRLLGEGKK